MEATSDPDMDAEQIPITLEQHLQDQSPGL